MSPRTETQIGAVGAEQMQRGSHGFRKVRMALRWIQREKCSPDVKTSALAFAPRPAKRKLPRSNHSSARCASCAFRFRGEEKQPFSGQLSVCVPLCFSLHRCLCCVFVCLCLPVCVSVCLCVSSCTFLCHCPSLSVFPSLCRLVFVFLGLTEVNRLPRSKASVNHLRLRSQTGSQHGYIISHGFPKAI